MVQGAGFGILGIRGFRLQVQDFGVKSFWLQNLRGSLPAG